MYGVTRVSKFIYQQICNGSTPTQQYFNYIIVISVGNQGTQKKVHNLDCKICIKYTSIVDNKIFKP
jgi:hypothetical protein